MMILNQMDCQARKNKLIRKVEDKLEKIEKQMLDPNISERKEKQLLKRYEMLQDRISKIQFHSC